MKPTTISELISAAKKDDRIAFTKLLNHYWAEVYHFMLKRTNNENDAEDIVIETFSKAFANISKFDETYAFNTWLISIAKNVHIDMIRKRSNISFLDINDESQQSYSSIIDDTMNIEDEIIQEQNIDIFKSYLKLLKPPYREVIEMRFFQEMSYNEIAETLNEPLNNVKVRIMRAKKLLAEIIVKQIDKNFTV